MSNEWPAPFQPVGPPPPPPPQPPVRAGRAPLEYFLFGGIVVGAIVALAIVGMIVLGTPTVPASPTQIAVASSTPSAPPTSAASPATTPTASATPSAGSSPTPGTSGSLLPGQTLPPDIAAQIDEVLAQVPVIRELEPTRDVPYRVLTREQFQQQLDVLIAEDIDPAQLGAQERLLKRIGLLPATADLRALTLQLYGGQVAAFYLPEAKTFYVIQRDQPFGALDRFYVSHEYTHALQDMHFDLDANQITDPAEGDAALAQLAAIEGDATDVMILWAQQNLSVGELLQMIGSLGQGGQAGLENMPLIMRRQLDFPYNEGYLFVSGIQADGGWDGVNDALRKPPKSTEQILHPEKYAAREAPVEVRLPDVSADLGEGWSRTYLDTVGELNLQVFAAGNELPSAPVPGTPAVWPHAESVAGWGGDRLAMWEGPAGAWAIGWRLAWDTPTDADEFVARAGELESRFGGPAAIDRVDGKDVLVLIASDQATIDEFGAALGQ